MSDRGRYLTVVWVVLVMVTASTVVGVTAGQPAAPTSATAQAQLGIGDGVSSPQLEQESPPAPPSARATASPTHPDPGAAVTFDAAASSDPDGEIIEYRWDFDADGAVDRTTDAPTTSFEYEATQVHTAVLTVVDDQGLNDTTTASVSILSAEPEHEPMGEVETTGTGEESLDQEYSNVISFRGSGEHFTPEAGLNDSLLEVTGDTVAALIQFEFGIGDQRWELLRDHGYERERWLTPTARYATLPRDELLSVADLAFVRAITPIRPRWRLDPGLAEYMAGVDAETEISVAVSSLAPLDQPRLTALAETQGTGYLGRLPRDQIRELQHDERVVWIERFEPPSPSVVEGRELINADGATRTFPDLKGSGVRVGILDTGIDHDHPHFSNVHIVDAKDWGDGDTYPEAPQSCSHGTHVAGTIAGGGDNTTDNVGPVTGVAPGATPVVSRVFVPDDAGFGSDDDKECDWVGKLVGPKKMFTKVQNKGAVILQNSWGRDTGGKYDLVASWVDTWAKHHQQIPIVFSNGNAGESSAVSSPAVGKNVIAVGAVRDGSKRSYARGKVRFTNVESRLNDLEGTLDMQAGSERQKPEVSAPGHFTYAPVNGGNHATGGNYGMKMGTSMAAPHVSGAAALYKQIHPSMDAGEVRAALVATTTPVYGTQNQSLTPVAGHGMVNVENAIFQNEYETLQNHWEGHIKNPIAGSAPTRTHSFTVDETAEQVVVALTYHDPGHTPVVNPTKDREDQKGKGIMVNNLHMEVGPSFDADRYVDGGPDNVRYIVVDDPEPAQWKITVKGNRITPGTTQRFDVVYRVVNETAELYVPRGNSVEIDKGTRGTFTSNISGQGAPVGGIYTKLVADDPELSRCNDGVQLVGVLSKDDEATIDHCLKSFTYGDYKATMFVYSTSPGAAGHGRMGSAQIIEQEISVHVAENQPPKAVSGLHSTTHVEGSWSGDPSIGFEWEPAEDRGPSGISHYLVRLDQSPTTIPDPGFWVGATAATRSALSGSGEYYFHVQPVDNDGNKAKPADVRHAGPFKIDVDEPTQVTLTPEHDEFLRDPSGFKGESVGYTNDSAIEYSWSPATDSHSGLDGYNVTLYNSSTACQNKWIGCRVENLLLDDDETSFGRLTEEGLHQVVVGAVDAAGNENVTWDYVLVDRTAPTASIAVDTPNPIEGVPVSFDASGSFDKSGVHEYRWNFGDNETATTTSPTTDHTYDSQGTYLARVTVVDRAGNRANASIGVDIGNASVEGSVLPVGFGHRATYDDLEPGQWYPRDIPSPSELYRRIAGARIALNPSEPLSQLDLWVTIVDRPPARSGPFEQALAVEEGSPYFFLAHDRPYAGQTRFDYTVDRDLLNTLAVPPASVRLFRYGGGAWRALDTRRLATTDTHVRYRSEFDGLSVFAVGHAKLLDVDVKPDADELPAPMRPGSGVTPVVIYTTDKFDATTVDVATLRFGAPTTVSAGDGATAAHAGHLEDVDGDGDRDLVVHFAGDTGLEAGDSTGRLVGETAAGMPVFGTDSVRIVGDGGGPPDDSGPPDDGGPPEDG